MSCLKALGQDSNRTSLAALEELNKRHPAPAKIEAPFSEMTPELRLRTLKDFWNQKSLVYVTWTSDEGDTKVSEGYIELVQEGTDPKLFITLPKTYDTTPISLSKIRLISEGEPDYYPAREWRKQLNSYLMHPYFVPLDVGTLESVIDGDSLQLIRRSSNGVITALDFLKLPREQLEGGFALGLTSSRWHYQALSELKGLQDWHLAYKKLKIDYHNDPYHTEKFLSAITASGKKIVFFVPSRAETDGEGTVTNSEIQWMLNHSEQLKNVIFVFGAYEIFDKKTDDLFSELKENGWGAVEKMKNALLKWTQP